MISKERLRKIIYNNTIFDTATDLNTHYDKHNASIQKDVRPCNILRKNG